MNNEPSDCAVTRRASSDTSSFVKSSSWPLLQNAIRQPVPGMNDINSVIVPPEDTVVYDMVTTVPCQPIEDQDALYISIGHSSLRNRGDETINFDGPFREDDDCSDCTTDEAIEGSSCVQIIDPNYSRPQIPQSNWLEDNSPLMMQDGSTQSVTISAPSTTNGKMHSGKSECVCNVLYLYIQTIQVHMLTVVQR